MTITRLHPLFAPAHIAPPARPSTDVAMIGRLPALTPSLPEVRRHLSQPRPVAGCHDSCARGQALQFAHRGSGSKGSSELAPDGRVSRLSSWRSTPGRLWPAERSEG